MLDEASDATFDGAVLSARVPVVVEFYATWCGNCRRVAPTVEKLAAEFAPRVAVVQVNADDNPELVRRFGVSSTPTFLVLDRGEQVASLVGAQPEAVLRDLFTRAGDGGGLAVDESAGWVPADACSLPTAERPMRLAEFDALFAAALEGLERAEPGWLRLRLAAGEDTEARVRDLVARESECCSFFDFALRRGDGQTGDTELGLVLDVRVPPSRIEVLDGLAQQARAARPEAWA